MGFINLFASSRRRTLHGVIAGIKKQRAQDIDRIRFVISSRCIAHLIDRCDSVCESGIGHR